MLSKTLAYSLCCFFVIFLGNANNFINRFEYTVIFFSACIVNMYKGLRSREIGHVRRVKAPLPLEEIHKHFSPYNFAKYLESQFVNVDGTLIPRLSKRTINKRNGMWTVGRIVGNTNTKNKKVAHHSLFAYINPAIFNRKHNKGLKFAENNNKNRIRKAKNVFDASKKNLLNYKRYYNSYTNTLLNNLGI